LWLQRLVELDPKNLEAAADLAAALAADQPIRAAEIYRDLSQREPADSRWLVGLGEALRQAGQLEAAAEALTRARQLDPEGLEIWLASARLAGQSDRNEQAYQEATHVLQAAPGTAEAISIALRAASAMAIEARHRGDSRQLLCNLRRAAEHDPQNADRWRALGETQRLAGDAAGAAQAYQKAFALDPDDLATASLAAELFRSADNLEAARSLYLAILERDADHGPTLLALARQQWQQGDLKGACWYLGRIGAYPGHGDPEWHAEVRLLQAAVSWQQAQYREAHDFAKDALQLVSEDSLAARKASTLAGNACKKLALASEQIGEPQQARRWWIEAARLVPADRAAFRGLANLLLAQECLPEAQRIFERLVEADGLDSEAAYGLGACLSGRGLQQEAQDAFERAAANGTQPKAAIALSRLALDRGDLSGTWDWARTALNLEPDNLTAHGLAADAAIALAAQAAQKGDNQAEASWWERAADLRPQGRERLLALARAQLQLGKPALAAASLLRLQDEEPADAEVAFALAQALKMAGDDEGALLHFRHVLFGLPGAQALGPQPDSTAVAAALAEAAALEDQVSPWLKEQTLLELTRLAIDLGRAGEAWEWSQALLSWQPDHGEAKALAAKCAEALAQTAEAEGDPH
ncbi:MAG: tetratricopeptide repeat protein, partial [Cyanobacteria bacterium REEB65]|nr:tetratricopeptide repeat protein [Cyanobacteria bacterium REEB65]